MHGGGKEISRWVNKVGMEPHFINGLRVTDDATMEIAEMVLNKVNKSLVQMVQQLGVSGVGITGKDGGLLKVKKKYSNGEDIGYVGFSNFDIKYDQRDGKYKVFEINCRQGRSNYYVTGAGYNIAKLLVEDRVEGKELPFVLADNPSLWRVVPRKVAFAYIVSDYHQEMKQLMHQGREVRPLFYDKDKPLMRTLRMEKNLLGHFKKFKQYYERKA